MIAIPVTYNEEHQLVPSELFGNVNHFALYDDNYNFDKVIKNTQSGNGIATAELLLERQVSTALYLFLGDGPYKALTDNGVAVYHIDKPDYTLDGVIQALKAGQFTQVTPENAKTLLNPGTASGECGCGCSHE